MGLPTDVAPSSGDQRGKPPARCTPKLNSQTGICIISFHLPTLHGLFYWFVCCTTLEPVYDDKGTRQAFDWLFLSRALFVSLQPLCFRDPNLSKSMVEFRRRSDLPKHAQYADFITSIKVFSCSLYEISAILMTTSSRRFILRQKGRCLYLQHGWHEEQLSPSTHPPQNSNLDSMKTTL
jgi:hypothetical protein